MKLIPVKTPSVAKRLFPSYIWDIKTEANTLYLTFDDGPTPVVTEFVLETLALFQAKATFFCIGENVLKYPDIYQKILDQGHSVGNHTHNHLNAFNLDADVYMQNVKKASQVIYSKLFRPPYGKLKLPHGKQLKLEGYNIVMWDVLSFDWDASVSKETCLNNVISKAKKGSIIVFHDSLKAKRNMTYALPKVLAHFSNQGFKFEKLVF